MNNRALWNDSASHRTTTVESVEKFKSVRILKFIAVIFSFFLIIIDLHIESIL